MQVAVGNMVTIILGVVTFIGGTILLGNIIDTTESQVEQLTQQERSDYLNSFPPRQTFYVPHARGTIEDNTMRIPFGIYNPSEDERTYNIEIELENEGSIEELSADDITYQREYTLDGGERQIFTAIVNSNTWPREQATFIMILNDEEGEEIDKKAVFT